MSKYVSQNPRPIYFDTIICVLSASGTAIFMPKRAKFVFTISPMQKKILNKLSRTHIFRSLYKEMDFDLHTTWQLFKTRVKCIEKQMI